MGELLIWTESSGIKELRFPLSADPQYVVALQLNSYFSICSYVLTTFDPQVNPRVEGNPKSVEVINY